MQVTIAAIITFFLIRVQIIFIFANYNVHF